MTGRRLYDHFTDALCVETNSTQRANGYTGQVSIETPTAWPALTRAEQRVWNTTARNIDRARRR